MTTPLKVVILSKAKDLLFSPPEKQILRFAQDDKKADPSLRSG